MECNHFYLKLQCLQRLQSKRLKVRSLKRGVTSYNVYKGYHFSRFLMNTNNVLFHNYKTWKLKILCMFFRQSSFFKEILCTKSFKRKESLHNILAVVRSSSATTFSYLWTCFEALRNFKGPRLSIKCTWLLWKHLWNMAEFHRLGQVVSLHLLIKAQDLTQVTDFATWHLVFSRKSCLNEVALNTFFKGHDVNKVLRDLLQRMKKRVILASIQYTFIKVWYALGNVLVSCLWDKV